MTDTPNWSTACIDWERRIVEREPIIVAPVLYPRIAAEGMEMFDSLRLLDVPGNPTLDVAAPPWVRTWANALFGALDPRSGRRRIWEHFVLVGKKNGKSTFAAAVLLVEFLRGYRKSADYAIVAPTREASDNSFQAVRDMVKSDPDLAAMVHVKDHVKTLEHRTTGAKLKVYAADSETVAGKRLSGLLIDELWLFGKHRGAENMLRELIGARAARPEFFVVYASTQSDEPPLGVWKTKLSYARRIRDAEIENPEFLPVLYEFPKEMVEAGEHLLPANFYIPNPSIGYTVDADFLAGELKKATDQGEDVLQAFAAKHLNVEPGAGAYSDRWVAAKHWAACADPTLTLKSLLARSDHVLLGVDAGGSADFTGLAVMGRDRTTSKLLLWVRCFVARTAMDTYKSEATRWLDFAADGDLVIYDQAGEDLRAIDGIVAEIGGKAFAAAVDAMRIQAIADVLLARGFQVDSIERPRPIVPVSQGSKMSPHIDGFDRALAAKEIVHQGSAMMAWQVSNARIELRGNARMLSKHGSQTKVDGLMAGLMAFAAFELVPKPPAFQVFFFGG